MYPPGTVANAVVRGVPTLAMVVTDGRRQSWATPYPIGTFTNHPDDQVSDVVPVLEPTQPKPPEPTAAGSRVLDDQGREWVRAAGPDTASAWVQLDTGVVGATYDQVNALQVAQ